MKLSGLQLGVAMALGLAVLVGAGLVIREVTAEYREPVVVPGCEGQVWSNRGGTPRVSRVVLVTIDTLRADHLKSYGYLRETSPFIDGLAAEGVLFERAFATVSHTAPSHASMLTGRAPAGHGLFANGQSLDPVVPSLGCLLAANGFRGGAFTSVRFLREMMSGFGERSATERVAAKTVDAALAWVETLAPDARFFLWVHIYDPHRCVRPF